MTLRRETIVADGRVALEVGSERGPGLAPPLVERWAACLFWQLHASRFWRQQARRNRRKKPHHFWTIGPPRPYRTASSTPPWPLGRWGAYSTVSRSRGATHRPPWSTEATMGHSVMPGRSAVKRQMKESRFQAGAVRRGRRDERIADWDRPRCGPFLFLLHSGNIPLACIPILEERDGDRSVLHGTDFRLARWIGPGAHSGCQSVDPAWRPRGRERCFRGLVDEPRTPC